MRIFISAGEPSGDLHAANLIRALRECNPGVEVVGFGGDEFARAGGTLLYPLVDLAVMWFVRVLLNIRVFINLLDRADAFFRDHRPDAVVLIDYPGFHWLLAKRARALDIPVIYYVPPQIWAWGGWRVNKVRKYIDHVLCSLPFEPAWYHARGVPGAVYVGHPYYDELAERRLDQDWLGDQAARGGTVIALLPGSRTQEIARNLPPMLRAAQRVARARPEVRFAVACLRPKHHDQAAKLVRESGLQLPLDVHTGRTAETIRIASIAWAVSGSVGLELMAEALPTVVVYTVGPLDLVIARPFIKARYISLVNLLADAEVMPEYLTGGDASPELARWALLWIDNPGARAERARALADLRDRVAAPGASARAADQVLRIVLADRPYRGPHAPRAEGLGFPGPDGQQADDRDGRAR
jgi:lipid-A-disaccharide synthase